jgi:hypothetical protein
VLQWRIQEDMYAVSSGIYRLSQQFRAELYEYLDSNTSFVRKYSLLLVVYIVLRGVEQRPQVYCSFQHPKDCTLKSWEKKNFAVVSGAAALETNDAPVTTDGNTGGQQ